VGTFEVFTPQSITPRILPDFDAELPVFWPRMSDYTLGPGHRVPCRWNNGSCNIGLDDVSAAGLIRHLKAFHFNDSTNQWNNKARGVCMWGDQCGGGEMNYENIGKHIAAVHLRSLARICTRCNRVFARPDTLSRHLNENCLGTSDYVP